MTEAPESTCPFGPRYQVYWDMRYELFSRFDEARVDAAGLYTMVPEAAALHLAKRATGSRVLDVCSGIGSMSIAFARAGKQVTAVEIDTGKVEMARHNARVYGVADRIEFLVGDITSRKLLETLPEDIDTLFLDPPWGKGPGDYRRRGITQLSDLALADTDLRALARGLPCREVMLRIPPNFDIDLFRDVPGDKVGFTTGSGLVHWYFVRIAKQAFVDLPDKSAP